MSKICEDKREDQPAGMAIPEISHFDSIESEDTNENIYATVC